MKKKNDMVKQTIGTGIASMAGMGAMGAMGSIPGMPAASGNVIGIAGSGLALANVGNVAKIGMNIIPKSKFNSKNFKWKG